MNNLYINDKCNIAANFRKDIVGEGNSVSIDSKRLWGNGLVINGNNNTVIFEKDSSLCVSLVIKANGCKVVVGENTTMMNVRMSLHETGNITIGEDCMFSGDVLMDVSDMHSIIDVDTGERVNPAKDIYISQHVWLGFGVMVLKGAHIEEGAIFGAKSLVHGHYKAFTLNAGVPAKVIREGVTWNRKLI